MALAAACGIAVQATKLLMLQIAAPPVVRVITAVVAAAITLIGLTRIHPRLFIGDDGLWMWEQLQVTLPALRWIRFVPPELRAPPAIRATRP